ncbi:MAG: hypothetical protein LBR23_05675 [Spirochaetaceae bacterium]|jgi:hypothetical protein|nr:hypothetical protein [Spirochaetaceae bacterium]
MGFVDKAKEYLDTSVRVSKDMLVKAGGAVQEMGDKGMLKLEITRLKGMAKKDYEKLGLAVYDSLGVQKAKSVTAKKAEIAALLDEISGLNESIEEKTRALNAASPQG